MKQPTAPFSTDTDVFDIVNDDDVVIGQLTRGEVHRRRLFHRAVHILVFNSAGEVFIQRRSRFKDTCPLQWTTSCSGHVDAGESYDEAAVRELGEELGIQITSAADLDFLFRQSPCRETGQEFIRVYKLIWDGKMRLPPEEVEEGRFLETDQLDGWILREPDAFALSFRLVWSLFRKGETAG